MDIPGEPIQSEAEPLYDDLRDPSRTRRSAFQKNLSMVEWDAPAMNTASRGTDPREAVVASRGG